MVRRSMLLAALCLVVALACIGGAALFLVERPTTVRVAVPLDDHDDVDLLTAAGKVVRHGHHPIRFKVQPVENAKAAADALDEGAVDMAVVRTDDVMPAQGQTVVILHRDAAVLVAPSDSTLKDIGDLADHSVGVLDSDLNDERLLTTALAQYDVAPDKVHFRTVQLDGLADAFRSKQIDTLLIVGVISEPTVQRAVQAVARAGEGPPVFIAVPEADAIAQRSPAYDKFEVVKGAFHGSPPQPADEFDTLSVTHRLVASSALGDTVVADVTRFFLSERSALVALNPRARRIEAPSTDKGTALPVHPGTAAYIDDEEETFLDQYSDFIYLGAMFFGVIASSATAIFSRLNARGVRAVETMTMRLLDLLRLVRDAPDHDALTELETETDEIVSAALDGERARAMDERRLGTLALALDQVRQAIRDRRSMLDRSRRLLRPAALHRVDAE